MNTVSISDTGNEVTIELFGHEYPNAECAEDRKWINGKVSVKTVSFQGRFDGSFWDDDFKRFREEMGQLIHKQSPRATFSCLEEWLYLEICSSDALGHYTVSVKAQSNFAELTFSFGIEFNLLLKLEQDLSALELV